MSLHDPAPTPSPTPESAPERASGAHAGTGLGRVRFVTLCQQLLVLGVILAVLTPAARIVSIDFGPAPERDVPVPGADGGSAGAAALPPLELSAYAAVQSTPTKVPTQVVDPKVREVSLTGAPGARLAPGALAARTKVNRRSGVQRLVSEPQKVTGYGAVGVTWQHGDVVPDDEIKLKVRTRDGSGWSGWTGMDYHDDHGPDPDSAEGRRARPGTDELLVGEVADVQVKVITRGRPVPADMKLAVIDPGVATRTARQLPALDTGAGDDAAEPAVGEPDALETSDGDVRLARATYTPKPKIYSRKQWGADEKLRDKGSLRYFEVHAGFVHHTVNANNYAAEDVPAILRGIYAYHTQSRGWSDVGYNFLVDRFGRIWEGRYGGVDRPVVGAHTLGYNDDAFAMSAIGNFETAQPSKAMLEAYGVLFGWKLSLHGVDAASNRQYVTSKYFKAINGHRDAASTACPGKNLYAKLGDIRTLAKAAQRGFAGRQLERNIVGSDEPDLLVRRASDKRGFVVPLKKTAAGRVARGTPIDTGIDLSSQNLLLNAGDWNRDGHVDMITRRTSNGTLYLRLGAGDGTFGEAIALGGGFGKVGMLTAVGDMTGDGWPDLMGQPSGGSMRIYPGNGVKGFKASYVAYSKVTGSAMVGVGLWDADGAPDTMVRNGSKLVLYPGNGPGGLSGSKAMTFDLSPYDKVIGTSDMDVTGHPDLLLRRKDNGQLLLAPGTTAGVGKPVVVGYGYQYFDLIG